MVEKQNKLSLSPTEAAPELNPQEQFLNKLYQKTLNWLINEQKGKNVASIDPQEISTWTEHEGRHPGTTVSLSIDLEKGVIVKTKDRIFALVMGRQLQSRYSHERTLSFQFGTLPIDSVRSVHLQKRESIETIRLLVHQGMGLYGYGEFFVDDMTGQVTINCWADRGFSGSQEIERWPQDQLLTEKGTDACLEIIQRTSKNAFIR